jgi:class 3 adenylate cyclase
VDYIPKPFSLPVVEARVETHVQLKKYKDYLEEMVARRTNELSRSYDRLEQTVHAYERFVPKEFLNLLDREDIINVGLGDNRVQDMAILFADIRNFTGHSEVLGPEETFHFLNGYLREVVPIIRKHGGVIDKYIGDAIMAVFPCTRGCAVTAAVEMQRALRGHNSQRIGDKPVTVGIGIHYGEVMLGTIGEEGRMETTVISDIVNLGSRLEELTKVYGADILVSEEVMEHLEDKEGFETRFLDVIQVRGKTIPVSVYEVLDGSDAEIRERKLTVYDDYKKGWDLFCDGRIDEAAEHFERVLEGNPGDRAAELFLGRCREYF